MNATLTIEAKVIGQRRAAPKWSVPIPDAGRDGEIITTLRALINQIVHQEVAAFQHRQEEHRLLRVLSPSGIQDGVEAGRVNPGGSDLKQAVDPAAAVVSAIQAFQDGLYLVFVDGRQQQEIDQPLRLKSDSTLTFLRLTPLAGG